MLRSLRTSNPALIVASLALVAALAGTAVADQQATTSASKLNKKQKKQTKKIATKKADKAIDKVLPIDTDELAGEAVNSAKLGASSVIASKIADGVVNAKKLGTITERTTTISVINASQNNTTVSCNANNILQITVHLLKKINRSLDELWMHHANLSASKCDTDPNGHPAT